MKLKRTFPTAAIFVDAPTAATVAAGSSSLSGFCGGSVALGISLLSIPFL